MAAVRDLFRQEVRVINLGLETFALELERFGVAVIYVAWSPPAGGDPRKAALLAGLGDEEEQ